jgi:hypothetical protein
MKFGMHIMTSEPIPTAYFTNLSHQSVCLYVYRIITRQRLGKKDNRGNEYTRSNTRIVGSLAFYVVRVVMESMECLS